MDQEFEETTNNNATLLAAGTAMADPKQSPMQDGRPYLLVPDGYTFRELEPQRTPARPRGTAKMRDARSFIEYFNRFSDSDSLIYATLDPARFLAILDENEVEVAQMISPRYREFREEFLVPPSSEWKLWTATNRKHMTQLSFAELIEDNLPDFIDPEGTAMLTMALDFEASKSGAFRSAQKLQDGSVNFAYVDETKQNGEAGKIVMPPMFTIRIPVFENGTFYNIQARLKFRVADTKLSIWFELVRPHKTMEDAFREIWALIESETKRKILLGTPE